MQSGDAQVDLDKCAVAAATCACFHFRKAARVVTQYFDDSLQQVGLRSTQLVILIVLAVMRKISVARIAEILVMDRSTVARNLKPLARNELLTIEPGSDRRTRMVQLTDLGRRKLIAAMPIWERTQGTFTGRIGDPTWSVLLDQLNQVVAVGKALGVEPAAEDD
jgi:DNA-binding MarR family transcriptional regulator